MEKNTDNLTLKKQFLPDFDMKPWCTAKVFRDYVLIFGGSKPQHDVFANRDLFVGTNQLLLVDLDKNLCHPIQITGAEEIEPRFGHTACLYKDNQLIIFGGQHLPYGRPKLLHEVAVLELNNIETHSVEYKSLNKNQNALYYARTFHTAHILEDHMYVFGGLYSTSSAIGNPGSRANEIKPTANLMKFNLNTFEWSACKTYGETTQEIPNPCANHHSVLHKGKIYVERGEYQLNGYCFFAVDLGTYKWTRLLVKLPSNIRFLGRNIIKAGDKIYNFASQKDKSSPINQLISYDLSNERWEQTLFEETGPLLDSNCQFVHRRDEFIIFGNQPDYNVYSINIGVQFDNSDSMFETQQKKDKRYADQLKGLFMNTTFSDVTFIVQDQELPAHKNILAMRCNFFNNMFTSGMTESNSSKIEVSDIQFPIFKALLEFIYCDELSLDYDLAMNLLEVSDKYAYSDLKNECEQFLRQQIKFENLVVIANTAERFDAMNLKNGVVQFIIKNRQALAQREDARGMPESLLWEVISKI